MEELPKEKEKIEVRGTILYSSKEKIDFAVKKRFIFGFWHIAVIGNGEKIASEQLERIKKSGVYDASDEIFVVVLGEKIPDFISKDKKLNVFYHKNVRLFEYPSLCFMKHLSKEIDFDCWYIHTKGATSEIKDGPGAANWRKYMEHFIIDKWEICLDFLNNYGAVGVEFNRYNYHDYFAGNFWWAKSEYIRTLPEIKNFDLSDRFGAEMWIGWVEWSSLKMKNLFSVGQEKLMNIKEKEYENKI